jgi:Protein of unknown function (DUF3761)
MRRAIAALVAAATLSGLLVGEASAATLPFKSGPLPDATRTPGATDARVTQDNIGQTICVSGYTKTVRKASSKTKSKVFAKYHISKKDRSKYVIDHLIALSLGGSNDAKNLWPEPKKGDRNSISKDTVEAQLHTLVCNGAVPLATAQTAIAANWTTAGTTVTTTASTTTTTTPAPPPPPPLPTTAAPPPPLPAPPSGPSAPAGATAVCNDGTYSFSQHRRGTCSYHGGVREFIAPIPP